MDTVRIHALIIFVAWVLSIRRARVCTFSNDVVLKSPFSLCYGVRLTRDLVSSGDKRQNQLMILAVLSAVDAFTCFAKREYFAGISWSRRCKTVFVLNAFEKVCRKQYRDNCY